jgi:type I restriction enzyme R subunit
MSKKAPEMNFQQHIADFLIREHKYGVLEQGDITDTEHFIAEDQLWAFLKATQTDTLRKLVDDYGRDARDEVFHALRNELAHTRLWMLLRHGLKVRGLEFRIYYPKPRSADRASTVIVAHNHPSGGLEPSPSDINITAMLKAAGAIVGIDLLDRIIFNRTAYFSFLEDGRL